MIAAVAEALGHNIDDLVINRSSIHEYRKILRKNISERVKTHFCGNLPNFAIVHWDGKLLSANNNTDHRVERLPIVVTSENLEQLIAVPKLERSTGREQAMSVCNALQDWGLPTIVEAICFDTTASNTGRFNGACVLIEMTLEKNLLYLPCRHHIFELVLRAVFDTKMKQVTNSPDIPMFKKIKENWSTINPKKCISGFSDQKCRAALEDKKEEILNFLSSQLQIKQIRDDYRELLELSVLFLGGDNLAQMYNIKIRPPGAIHHRVLYTV